MEKVLTTLLSTWSVAVFSAPVIIIIITITIIIIIIIIISSSSSISIIIIITRRVPCDIKYVDIDVEVVEGAIQSD